jgi:hypothetical protein
MPMVQTRSSGRLGYGGTKTAQMRSLLLGINQRYVKTKVRGKRSIWYGHTRARGDDLSGFRRYHAAGGHESLARGLQCTNRGSRAGPNASTHPHMSHHDQPAAPEPLRAAPTRRRRIGHCPPGFSRRASPWLPARAAAAASVVARAVARAAARSAAKEAAVRQAARSAARSATRGRRRGRRRPRHRGPLTFHCPPASKCMRGVSMALGSRAEPVCGHMVRLGASPYLLSSGRRGTRGREGRAGVSTPLRYAR